MSFRNRLTLFFVLIVIVPMVAVALVLFRLIADNETGKADQGVEARLEVARGLYGDAVNRADVALRQIGADPGLVQALAQANTPVVQRRATRLVGASPGVRRLVLSTGPGVLVDVGDRSATAPAERELVGVGGRGLGQIEVSVQSAGAYVDLARRLTGVEVVVRRQGRLVAATLPEPAQGQLPRVGSAVVGGLHYRVASFDARGFRGVPLRISVLSRRDAITASVGSSRLLAAAILAGFLILAFAFAVLVSRSLQQQIGSFLIAARRLGGGDFSAQVPVSGRDEFAALGDEFNKMSAQLEARLEELSEQRARVGSSLQRIGEAFASNLDRDALLEIILRTAIDGVGAHGGRAVARRSAAAPLVERARESDLDGLDDALERAQALALRTSGPSEAETEHGWALGHPLVAGDEGNVGHGVVLGTVMVARRDRGFTSEETELFHYLAGQASVSLENVSLHERVQRQAVTDELTGLYNHRRFQEALTSEAGRSKRFGHEMGLIMLDIDNFKRVNDTYGHQQGDMVLREVARILRESSRDVDSPARYGGEELAVVLPQTSLEGAFNFAERVRTGIERLEMPLLEGEGTVSVTASFGVAAVPISAIAPHQLVALADAALYRAKHSGKNKTELPE